LVYNKTTQDINKETDNNLHEAKLYLDKYRLTTSQKILMDKILQMMKKIRQRNFSPFDNIPPPILLVTGLLGIGKSFCIEKK